MIRILSFIRRDAVMAPIVTCVTSFVAGFIVFSVAGFMSVKSGVHVTQAMGSGWYSSTIPVRLTLSNLSEINSQKGFRCRAARSWSESACFQRAGS